MPRGGNGAMPEEYGNIFLLAVSNARDGKNLVCQRHNAVSGRVAASDTPEILAAVERVRREKSTEDEMQFEGRGVPSGLKVYVACDSSFTYSVVVDRAYPDRHGYQMLREFARQMAGDYGGVLRGTKKAGGATGKVERVTTSLLEKYDDLANVDKVAALQSEVDKVKSRMNDNIQAQFANMESADDLEESTALMRDTGEKRRRQETPASPRLASPCSAGPCPAKRAGVVAAAHLPGWFKSADAVLLLTLLRACCLPTASDFKQGSNKLRKKMWWKNAKLNACILLIVLGTLMYPLGLSCHLPAVLQEEEEGEAGCTPRWFPELRLGAAPAACCACVLLVLPRWWARWLQQRLLLLLLGAWRRA
eukprot:COSAG06_NODE_14031_length_1196_cov_1.446673_1_plen_362_part_01